MFRFKHHSSNCVSSYFSRGGAVFSPRRDSPLADPPEAAGPPPTSRPPSPPPFPQPPRCDPSRRPGPHPAAGGGWVPSAAAPRTTRSNPVPPLADRAALPRRNSIGPAPHAPPPAGQWAAASLHMQRAPAGGARPGRFGSTDAGLPAPACDAGIVAAAGAGTRRRRPGQQTVATLQCGCARVPRRRHGA